MAEGDTAQEQKAPQTGQAFSEAVDDNPLAEHDVAPGSQTTFLGLHLKNPVKTLGEAYGRLDRGKKQNMMYLLQCSAAACILAGGAVGMASGAPAVICAGMMGTGTLNGIRSVTQYMARRRFAKSADGNSKTEMANSIASGMTNAPQAFSGSLAGVAAMLTYCLRTVKYALENEESKAQAVPETSEKLPDAPQDETETTAASATPDLENEEIRQTKVTALGPVEKKSNILSRSFNRAAVGTGKLIRKMPHGDALLDRGPGSVMVARGVFQSAEGVLLALMEPVTGCLTFVAGNIYMAAATVMSSADSQKNKDTAVDKSKTELPPEHGHQPEASDNNQAHAAGPDMT